METPSNYTSFFDSIPKIDYIIDSTKYPIKESATNLFYRLNIVQQVIDTISSYYVYEVQEGETPEILAEKVYGDAGANWMILMANRICDPQFEWPLNYDAFNQYVANKYGSVDIAKSTVHHFEKVITRRNPVTEEQTVSRHWVDKERLTQTMLNVPYNYFIPWVATTHRTADSIDYKVDAGSEYNVYLMTGSAGFANGEIVFASPDGTFANNTGSGSVNLFIGSNNYLRIESVEGYFAEGDTIRSTLNSNTRIIQTLSIETTPDLLASLDDGEAFGASLTKGNLAITAEMEPPRLYDIDGQTVEVTIRGNSVSCYDYEAEINEQRKTIKIIKAEFYNKILTEFRIMTMNVPDFIRRLA